MFLPRWSLLLLIAMVAELALVLVLAQVLMLALIRMLALALVLVLAQTLVLALVLGAAEDRVQQQQFSRRAIVSVAKIHHFVLYFAHVQRP